ncbi:MAG TPA: hypothetical protein VGB33_00085 [Acidimicrobiia bacterium]|jgi:hypothetical protein
MTDEIRERLAGIDPMHSGVPTEPVTSESSRQLLEGIMSTPTTERDETSRSPKTTWMIGVAAVAALVVAVGGAIALTGGDEGPGVAEGPPLELTAPDGGTTTTMCIQFSVDELAKMEMAFEGTVTSAEEDTVNLDVDHWFKGGDATKVILRAPQGLEALIDGFPFETGQQYLITAFDGNVNYCGFSGPSTPEFRAAFEEAFGS